MTDRKIRYGAGLVALIFGTLLLAAAALTVIFRGEAAFPVQVFGPASLDDGEQPELSIRGPRTGEVLRGRLGDLTLPELTYLDSASSVAAGPPVDAELERARRLANQESWPEAISAYDALVASRSARDDLAIERARVLSYSGDELGAARALDALKSRRPLDADLRIEAARYYWFAGEIERADELLSEAREIGTDNPELAELTPQVRAAYTPDVEAASRWVGEDPSWPNRVALARAFLVERQWIAAADEFDLALVDSSAPDSLYLEMAAAATAADSIDYSIAALEAYLSSRPEDRGVRLQFARALSWQERYPFAIREYELYLEGGDDAEARFELAQILTWTGDNEAAGRELRRVAEADPLHGPTYRLLGDLAWYSGDHELAIANYRYAADLLPGDPLVRTALREVEEEYASIRRAAMPLPLGSCTLTFDTFTDSEGFQWVSTHGSRIWRSDWGAIEVTAEQALSAGRSDIPEERRLGGIGGTVALYLPISQTASIDLLAGTQDFGDFGRFARAGLGIEVRDVAGATIGVTYDRGPALQRAATIASLQAGTKSDLVQATINRQFSGWSGYGAVEGERLKSSYGTTFRYGANVAVTRPLSDALSVTAGVSAITSSADSPRLPDGRTLYWTPELYLSPTLSLNYRRPIGERWTFSGTVTPGYAYVRERATGDQRFGKTHVPTFGAGLEVGYRFDDWEMRAAANWGGSVDATGYRSSSVRVEGAYRLGDP